MTMHNTHESGRSMIEMLGVLAIIGVLSVGGIAGYSQAMAKFKVTKVTDQVQSIVTNVRTLFSTQKNYAAIDNMQQMYAMGVIGSDVCGAGTDDDYTNCTSAFGGAFVMSSTFAQKTAYYIFMDQVPQDACVRLAMSDWGDQSSGFLALGIKTGENQLLTMTASDTTGAGLYTTSAGTVPLDLATALGVCAKSTSMTWTYR